MKIFLTFNQFKILGKKKQKSKSTEENTDRKKERERELQKPSWCEINTIEFEELTRDIYNNQDNNNFKIIINKRTYDLKNAKKFGMEVTTRKISKSEVKKLYRELIQKDIDALERETIDEKSVEIDDNILNILKNVGSIFTSTYLHCKNVPKETMFERSIAEKTILRRGRSDEIGRKEQKINNELFKAYFTDYQNPSSMHKNLSETKGTVNED